MRYHSVPSFLSEGARQGVVHRAFNAFVLFSDFVAERLFLLLQFNLPVVILLNVIVPYSEREGGDKLSDLRADVEELQKSQVENKRRIEGLKAIGVTLDQIKTEIEVAPWSDDILKLVEFCGGNCPLPLKTATQPTADKVIRTIASELQTLIVKRFRVAIDDALMADDLGQHATDIADRQVCRSVIS